MILPDDYATGAGEFAAIRARRFAKHLETICGSPIETLIACALFTSIEGVERHLTVVHSEEEMDAAPDYFMWPQRNIGRHRVDFYFGLKGHPCLVIECDGREFHHATREQIERDRARDAELQAAGYTVHRYPGTQIHNNFWRVAIEILCFVDGQYHCDWFGRHEEFCA